LEIPVALLVVYWNNYTLVPQLILEEPRIKINLLPHFYELVYFSSKKSQFKVKDMLLHQFHTDRIAFNPNSTFITNLWNSEFFWYCQTLLQV